MTKAELQPQWDQLKLLLTNVRKQMELIPDTKIGYKPTPEVRSFSELCTHLHEYLTEITDTVKTGQQSAMAVPAFSDKQKLLAWCDGQVTKGFSTFNALTDAQLAAKVNAWGQTFPGWQLLTFVNDEVLHHRGQLTVYLRLIGIPPIFIYNFEQ